MSAEYYAKRGEALFGPFDRYSLAIENHARFVGMSCAATQPGMGVLLDVGSFSLSDERELRAVLHDDPLLRAVFELGRRTTHVTISAQYPHIETDAELDQLPVRTVIKEVLPSNNGCIWERWHCDTWVRLDSCAHVPGMRPILPAIILWPLDPPR